MQIYCFRPKWNTNQTANGTVTTVNLKTGQITCNGTSYALSDYVEEGGLLS